MFNKDLHTVDLRMSEVMQKPDQSNKVEYEWTKPSPVRDTLRPLGMDTKQPRFYPNGNIQYLKLLVVSHSRCWLKNKTNKNGVSQIWSHQLLGRGKLVVIVKFRHVPSHCTQASTNANVRQTRRKQCNFLGLFHFQLPDERQTWSLAFLQVQPQGIGNMVALVLFS